MSNKPNNYQKHLNQEQRIVIEKGLDSGKSIKTIAQETGKDPTTISKEIKRHRIFKEHNTFNRSEHRCNLTSTCRLKNVCGTYGLNCRKQCRNCPRCYRYCPDYVPYDYHCSLTDRAPFVCNACSKKAQCRLDKYFYRAVTAHRNYKTVLVESRTGINISKDGLALLDEKISPLVKQGHSIYSILNNHPEIKQCEKTIYNYVQSGALSIKNIDLPKKVKYKLRKSSNTSESSDTGIFEGRTYKDFLDFMTENPDTRITQMDTVIGCNGSKKVLLTLHFCAPDFMMAFLLDSKEAYHVKIAFDRIEERIGTLLFAKAMPLILTDRGSEFKRPDSLECGIDNIIRTSIYYCDPMASWQKPHCEKNHEYIRKICPKGSTFDNLTQKDVNLMMSHINSACRESLGGLTPFALASMMLPKELLTCFGLEEIPADEVILTPKLLSGKLKLK